MNNTQAKTFADIVQKVLAVFPDAEIGVRRYQNVNDEYQLKVRRQGITFKHQVRYNDLLEMREGVIPPLAKLLIHELTEAIMARGRQ